MRITLPEGHNSLLQQLTELTNSSATQVLLRGLEALSEANGVDYKTLINSTYDAKGRLCPRSKASTEDERNTVHNNNAL